MESWTGRLVRGRTSAWQTEWGSGFLDREAGKGKNVSMANRVGEWIPTQAGKGKNVSMAHGVGEWIPGQRGW